MCFNNKPSPPGACLVTSPWEASARSMANGANPRKVVGFLPRGEKCMTGDGEKDEIQIQID